MMPESMQTVRIHPLALPVVQKLTHGDLRRMTILEIREGLVVDMLIK